MGDNFNNLCKTLEGFLLKFFCISKFYLFVYFYFYVYHMDMKGGARGVIGCARGVMVIVVGNEHCDTSSNPGRNSLHFT